MSRHRLSLCPCTAPLSCSLQHLLKLSLLSLRPSLLQLVSIVSPLSPSLRFGLPGPHRDATTLSPCWAPHFMTQERIMFSNPTLSEPRLSPAATMSDATPSALTPSLHCASILQPAAPLQVVAFESQTIPAPICLNCFTFAESRKSDLRTCVCVLPFPLLPLLFWQK